MCILSWVQSKIRQIHRQSRYPLRQPGLNWTAPRNLGAASRVPRTQIVHLPLLNCYISPSSPCKGRQTVIRVRKENLGKYICSLGARADSHKAIPFLLFPLPLPAGKNGPLKVQKVSQFWGSHQTKTKATLQRLKLCEHSNTLCLISDKSHFALEVLQIPSLNAIVIRLHAKLNDTSAMYSHVPRNSMSQRMHQGSVTDMDTFLSRWVNVERGSLKERSPKTTRLLHCDIIWAICFRNVS